MSRLWIVVMTLALLVPALFAQQEQATEESYSGVVVGTGGAVGGKSVHFDFRIRRYATDGEIEELAALLKNKGQDALRSALEKQDVGRINPVMTTGNEIAVARKRKVGSDTIITIVTARTMPFIELYRSTRTRDYPFGFMQVKLDANGEGTGQIMAAAKIRFDKKKGQYEIESFGNQYLKAVNIRPMK